MTGTVTAAFGGHPHQSKNGSEEPIFDSFSLKGEALAANLAMFVLLGAGVLFPKGFSPRGEAVGADD